MIRAAIICTLMASPSLADGQTWFTSDRSMSEIVASTEPGCVAEIHINNRPTDYMGFASGALLLGDLHVGIAYKLNVDAIGSEQYQIFPPDGYIAMPQELTVRDDENGLVLICEWVGF